MGVRASAGHRDPKNPRARAPADGQARGRRSPRPPDATELKPSGSLTELSVFRSPAQSDSLLVGEMENQPLNTKAKGEAVSKWKHVSSCLASLGGVLYVLGEPPNRRFFPLWVPFRTSNQRVPSKNTTEFFPEFRRARTLGLGVRLGKPKQQINRIWEHLPREDRQKEPWR